MELRTIKNGRVKFAGKVYVPKDEYHGELDNTRWCFYKYKTCDLLAMWGDEKSYRAAQQGEQASEEDYNTRRPDNIIDKYIYWYFWVPEVTSTEVL